MSVEVSAFTVLGLEPDADGAAVDEAYRRLIKRYHPDRSGGDAARAADINRAYFELRRKRGAYDPEPPPSGGDLIGEAIYARRASRSRVSRRPRRRWRLWPFLAAGAVVLLLVEGDRIADAVPRLIQDIRGPWLSSPDSFSGSAAMAELDGELSEGAIRKSIRLAARLDEGSEERRSEESRNCHRKMRTDPSTEQLDRCTAFDYSVAMLQDRDPVSDGGPFGASAVTARQMAAARLLSNDFMEIEARLDRIRNRVDLALVQSVTPPARQSGGAEP